MDYQPTNDDIEIRNRLLSNPDNVRALRDLLLLKAHNARMDVGSFFEFVLKEEMTRQTISLAPHQKLMLDFVLAHPRSVLRIPANHSKTFTLGGMGLWMLGKNPLLRGCILSDTQGQAAKPLGMIRDYIEQSPELKLVFPELRQSRRRGDPWTQTELTVDRPPGIRDPSLIAIGYHGAITGARLNWILCDDLLSPENTATQDSRNQLYEWFDAAVLSRLDPKGARVCVTNTAWHQDDLTFRLEKLGWPTLIMDIEGGIKIVNSDFDSDDIRPAYEGSYDCRLTAFDDDTPLFPARFDREAVEALRKTHLPHRFNQLFMNSCRDNETARCKLEWIEQCKKEGRGLELVSHYSGSNPTFTGVDLAVSQGEESDDTCFFTFELLPDGRRLILDIDIGKYDGPTIVDKLINKHQNYRSILRVENNAAQDYIRQFALRRRIALPIRPHTTGRAKAHPEHGIESLFIELSNKAWIIPCDKFGRCHPAVQRALDGCLYYSPAKHTDDALMAWYFAREQAKKMGVPSGGQLVGKVPTVVANMLAR